MLYIIIIINSRNCILVLHKVRLWQKLFGKHEYMNTSMSPSAFCSPLRFKRDYDPITNTMMHVYKGGYWEGKYSRQWGVEFPRHILVIFIIDYQLTYLIKTDLQFLCIIMGHHFRS